MNTPYNPVADLLNRIKDRFPGLVYKSSYGEEALFYNPEGQLPNGVYALTIKTQDGPNDKASFLDRPGAYRVNIGLTRDRYESLFGPPPPRPPAGGIVSLDIDFTEYNRLMPHPVYAWMGWACVLNPSARTESELIAYLDEVMPSIQKKFTQKLKELARH